MLRSVSPAGPTGSTASGEVPPAHSPVRRRLQVSERGLLATMGIGLLHHVDHVLRYDHSGWPFRPDVNPFTYSLLVYPVIGLLFALRGWPWMRVALMTLVFLVLQTAHVFIESPRQQFHTWAAGVSDDPAMQGAPNLLHIQSTALGIAAAALSILLSASILITLVLFVREARRRAPASTASRSQGGSHGVSERGV